MTISNDFDPRETSFDPRHARWLTVAAVVLILAIHVAGRVGAYCCPLQADSYIYSSFGYRIARGDVLYRDMSDIKPPALSMLYALAYLLLPASRASVVPIESLFLLGGYYAIFRLSADIHGRSVALCVAVAAAVTINYFTVMGHVIEGFGLAENFMILPAAAAVLFYRRGALSGRSWPLLAAGVCLGFDTAIKQTALPVVMAVAVHWSWFALISKRSPRRWLAGCALGFAGGCLAWSPFVFLMIAQGTLHDAFTLLTRDAGAMIGRSSAWPTQWREVLPLWLPIFWIAWGALAWIESRFRSRSPLFFVDLLLLSLWCAAELALLSYLPLRSSHYYVVTCVPLVLLSGAGLASLLRSVRHLSQPVRVATWSMAVIGSGICLRPSVDAIVPAAIARYRAYDWLADQRYFDEAINWGRIHFGRGEPWVEEE